MPSKKISLKNKEGYTLSAKLELPATAPKAFAIFAHCFTCTKNLSAVRNIAKTLNLSGFGVLRFDFTGLGDSEGDFADTNFTSNVEDLIAAANYLQENHQTPTILIGHSLGGAAVLSAAGLLPEVKAVATIGAPFDPHHVSHLFEAGIEEIKSTGQANVTIGGRSFKVKKQFLDDLETQVIEEKLRNLRKAILVMHSPQDRTVEVENARRIYSTAHHPKSFVSLDGADHLLSRKEDSLYVGEMIACWAKRYVNQPEKEALKVEKQVAVRLGKTGFTSDVMVRQHSLTADEPESIGGNDFGATPYELVAAGLGACTAMTIQMYARRKKWVVDEVKVHLDHKKDYTQDMSDVADEKPIKIDQFNREIILDGDLTSAQKQRLLEIADKCPVHRTLHGKVEINTVLKE